MKTNKIIFVGVFVVFALVLLNTMTADTSIVNKDIKIDSCEIKTEQPICSENTTIVAVNMTIESTGITNVELNNVSICIALTNGNGSIHKKEIIVDYSVKKSVVINFSYDETYIKGNYTLMSVIDCNNSINETNKVNNFVIKSFVIPNCKCKKILNYTIHLNTGFNLISLPLTPVNNSIESILKNTSYTSVYTYDYDWKYKIYAYNTWFGDLNVLNEKEGIWIDSDTEQNLTIYGYDIESKSIELKTGWNLIGMTRDVLINDLGDVYGNSPDNYESIYTYESGVWKFITRYNGEVFGDLQILERGKGYWIKVYEDSVLNLS